MAGGTVTVFRNITFLGASNRLNQLIVTLLVVIKQVIPVPVLVVINNYR